MMKKTHILTGVLTLFGLQAFASVVPDSIPTRHVKLSVDGGRMSVDMTLDMGDLKVNHNRFVVYTPLLVNGGDTLRLKPVEVFGRRRYYTYVRNGREWVQHGREYRYRATRCPDTLAYHSSVPYEEWMNGVRLLLNGQLYGCCECLLEERLQETSGYWKKPRPLVFTPEYVYVSPRAEVRKTRAISASAFIDFPVNRTDIREDYRNNRTELQRLLASVDSVRGDSDITVKSITLKGFASPEGTYANNARLAEGRTEALRQYLMKFDVLPADSIRTDFVPENWEGLRAWVERSDLPQKDKILALIDGDRKPDNKEWVLKSTYPAQYRTLLAECYPALRRTDYTIDYEIRSYSDPEEMLRILEQAPQKLSLQEFYLAAQALEKGSERFIAVFETAVRMYPSDEIANLNAANAAMSRGQLDEAGRYLAKAGDTPQAEYARGILAALRKEYDEAEKRFATLETELPEAANALRQVRKLIAAAEENVRIEEHNR